LTAGSLIGNGSHDPWRNPADTSPAREIPARVRAWAEEQLESEIIAIEPVGGGRTGTISAIYLRQGERVILRYVSIERWGEIGRQHVVCEALGCRLMEGSGLPVPQLIASDPDGSGAGDYANLTTWIPGQVRLGPLSLDAIDELAKIAVIIHGTPVDDDYRPRPFEFWTPDDLEVPSWTSRPELWRRAIDIFKQGPPSTHQGLIHRDFHPGNILWEGDRITGVIDWAETSWGPPDLDVMHSRANFAMLHDFDSADAFSVAYRWHGGILDDDRDAEVFWAVSDILGFLPDPTEIITALIHHRTDLPDKLVRERLEQLLMITIGDYCH
jgi:aminoglycoside phosphotransferase (APT) family kinase protein